MNTLYLALGSNLAQPQQQLRKAILLIEEQVGEILLRSHVYQTKAWGNKEQPDFFNQVLLVSTKLPALQVLHTSLKIEELMGRTRTEKNAARVIDIDILFFNSEIINFDELTIPHPLLQERNFVLIPLHEIAPRFIHPVLHRSVEELLAACKDELEVKKISGAF